MASAFLALTSLNMRTASAGEACILDMIERGEYALEHQIGVRSRTNKEAPGAFGRAMWCDTHPMGSNATSKPPKRSPTSANAGQTGALSSWSSSPPPSLRTARYAVSPAKYALLCERRSSTTQDPQSAQNRSNNPRLEMCCEGVQDSRTSVSTAGPSALEDGRATRKLRSSHQSSSWKRVRGVLRALER